MLFKRTLASFFALLILFSTSCASEKASDFSLLDTKGNLVKLSDYKGKIVFLDFWASWCPPCRNSIPAIKDLHKRTAGNSDIVILGINLGENNKTVEKFMKDQGMDYTVLYADNDVSKKYKISGIPAFFIIDRDGNIAKKYSGYANGLEKDWIKQIENLK